MFGTACRGSHILKGRRIIFPLLGNSGVLDLRVSSGTDDNAPLAERGE